MKLNTLVFLSVAILTGSLACGGEGPDPEPEDGGAMPAPSSTGSAGPTPEMPVVLDSGK
jgi:hypothetical protein